MHSFESTIENVREIKCLRDKQMTLFVFWAQLWDSSLNPIIGRMAHGGEFCQIHTVSLT